jgi:hypothetical protein
MRWRVPAVGVSGAGSPGSAEVWLEPTFEGVVAHFFLRLDPPAGQRLSRRRAGRIATAYRRRTKQAFWALADELDPGRIARHTSAARGTVPARPRRPPG